MAAWRAMLALALTAVIVLGYAASLWRLLRRESAVTVLAVAVICCLALSLRLVYTTDFPAGLNEDEVKSLKWGADALRSGGLFRQGVEGPVLLNALFEGQLIPVIGATRWAIRGYSLVTGVLACAAAFAVGRAMGLRVAASLAISGFVAVLPWSIFYGRVAFGGELVFHQLLLLAALARLVWAEGGWPEVGIAALGLSLLLYDYAAGRAMLAMPLAVAVLVPRNKRPLCLAVIALALLAWSPYLKNFFGYMAGGFRGNLEPQLAAQLLQTLVRKTTEAFTVLTSPTARNGWITIRAGAMHPWPILALAVLGVFTGVRRGLFLAAGFCIGLTPSVLSEGLAPSAHRMLMVFPFIALAAGSALDALRPAVVRRLGAVLAVAVVGVMSVRLYFSPQFFPPDADDIFIWERTALLEALPPSPHPPLIVDRRFSHFFMLRSVVDSNYEFLTAENWFPRSDSASIYAFAPHSGPLAACYEHLFGPQRMQYFGRAFIVTLEKADWSWLRQHGWRYETQCRDETRRGQVPVLYHSALPLSEAGCPETAMHVWRGRWLGPATPMRLHFSGTVSVDTPRGRVPQESGYESSVDFSVEPNDTITISLNASWFPDVALMEITPAGERLPAWENVSPK